MDWQIKWAVEHGISFFAFDWYWDRGRRQLEHALARRLPPRALPPVHEVLPPLGEPQPAGVLVGGRSAGDDGLLDRRLLSPARLPHDRRQAGRDRLHPAGAPAGHGHRRGARGLRADARAGAGGGAAGHLHHGGGAGESTRPRGARPRGVRRRHRLQLSAGGHGRRHRACRRPYAAMVDGYEQIWYSIAAAGAHRLRAGHRARVGLAALARGQGAGPDGAGPREFRGHAEAGAGLHRSAIRSPAAGSWC